MLGASFSGGVISTGSLKLDILLGSGGIPGGVIAEIFGPESSGKSTFCYQLIAEAQKLGGECVLIDADHAFEALYGARCGIELDRLLLCEPKSCEQALDIAVTLARCGAIAVIAIDTLTALAPLSEMQEVQGKTGPGCQARLISNGLHKLANAVAKTGTIALFTNQLRYRLNNIYPDSPASTASLSLKLHAALRLELSSLEPIYKNNQTVGNQVRISVIKNKFAPPLRATKLDIMYNEGTCKIGEILDLATEMKLIKRQDSSYCYRDLHLGERREDAMNSLRRQPLLSEEIEKIIRLRSLPANRMQVEH